MTYNVLNQSLDSLTINVYVVDNQGNYDPLTDLVTSHQVTDAATLTAGVGKRLTFDRGFTPAQVQGSKLLAEAGCRPSCSGRIPIRIYPRLDIGCDRMPHPRSVHNPITSKTFRPTQCYFTFR